jgi:hypothetical protein
VPKTYKSKLLAGAAPLAVLALIECAVPAAQAQDMPAWLKPVRYDIFAEGGYSLGSSVNEIPFAEFNNGAGTRFPFKMDPGSGLEGRVGAGIHFGGGWNANVGYTGLRINGKDDTGQHPNFFVYTILGGSATSWNRAVIKTSISANIVDFQAGYDVGLGNPLGTGAGQATLLAGVRYGQVKQNTEVDVFSAANVLQVHDARRSSFIGAGPSLGAKASLPLNDRVSLDGSALGAAMVGRLSSDTDAAFVPAGAIPVNHVHTNKVAWSSDAQLALSVSQPYGSTMMLFSVGYRVSYLANVRDTANQSSTAPFAQYGSTTADLLSHGPFARLTFSF